MGWNEEQKGYFGGNRPDPNNTQANYDYIAGQNRKNAEDHAARMAQTAAAYAAAPAPTYSAPPTYTPTTSHSPSVSSPSSFTPSAPSYSGGSYGRGSMTEEQTTALLYPDVVARRAAATQEPKKAYKTPWAAIFLGIIVGYGVALVPFALSGNFYHSAYLDKMGVSMAIFCAFVFWAIVELTRGRGRAALGTAVLGFFVPEVFWFTNGVTFLQAYSILFTRAVNHLAK